MDHDLAARIAENEERQLPALIDPPFWARLHRVTPRRWWPQALSRRQVSSRTEDCAAVRIPLVAETRPRWRGLTRLALARRDGDRRGPRTPSAVTPSHAACSLRSVGVRGTGAATVGVAVRSDWRCWRRRARFDRCASQVAVLRCGRSSGGRGNRAQGASSRCRSAILANLDRLETCRGRLGPRFLAPPDQSVVDAGWCGRR
jgi:hypothetical protein